MSKAQMAHGLSKSRFERAFGLQPSKAFEQQARWLVLRQLTLGWSIL
jgi:hypothetical protein